MALPDKNTEDAAIQKELTRLTDSLIQESILYFPVRHHSPACAWHLRQLIETRKPASILIEGPESLTPFIPTLADPALRAPVALYSQFVDQKDRTRTNTEEDANLRRTPNRFGAFYPLCDYSPELEAIRLGTQIKAHIAFCDLDFAVQKIIEHDHGDEKPSRSAFSIFDERYLAQNRYLKELARRTGCRDFNELWDRLFENEFRRHDTRGFMQKVATYCFFARRNTPFEAMQADGTLAREKRMFMNIQNELRKLKKRKSDRPLLVVTGGFHTPALILGQARLKKVSLPSFDFDEQELLQAIIPYSYRQLDALNGYASGMPSPFFYQKIWESAPNQDLANHHRVSLDFLVELARISREKKLPYPLSTADAIAANHLAVNLARFRGNQGPMREDILDGIRASFTKGSLDAEGDAVMTLASEMLCGDAVGFLPQNVRTHPLIEDFRQQARQLGLKLDSTRPQNKALKIYIGEKHREISRFFRMLDFLDVPFARFMAGPDFISGTSLSLTIEHWTFVWSPMTESALVDLSLKGVTIREAVSNLLRERKEAMGDEGASVGSTEAVGLLLMSCRLGLQELAIEFVPFVLQTLQAENTFEAAVHAGLHLDALFRVKSPLETGQLVELPRLLETAYQRACFLLAHLAGLPSEKQETALEALPECRELIAAPHNQGLLDAELFWDAADSVMAKAGLEAGLEGGLLGLYFSVGRCDAQTVCGRMEVQTLGRDNQGIRLSRFLQGLFLLCRELTWNNEPIMAQVCAMVSSWDDEAFYAQLPDLRLAFAAHTPLETDQVARLVAEIHKGEKPVDWYIRHTNEAFFLRCAAVAARVAESLKEDGLTE